MKMSDLYHYAGSSHNTVIHDESQRHVDQSHYYGKEIHNEKQTQIDDKQTNNDYKQSPNDNPNSHIIEQKEKLGLSVQVIKEEIVVNLDPTNHYNEEDYPNLCCTFCKQTFPTVADLMQHRLIHITHGFYQNVSGSGLNPDYNYHSIFDSYGTQSTAKTVEEPDPLAEEPSPPPPPKKTDAEKPFQCPICQKRLSNRSSFSRHTKAHTSTETFPCDICQKVFTRKCHLETHKKLHSGIKPFECQICLKLFSQNSYLKDHQKTHKSEKKYSCSICWKRFKSNSAFRTHEQIVHNGVRKFKCTYENCDKAFTRKAQWQLHERIHSGIKPFHCTICSRSFVRNCTLQEHLLTHSDIKPFFCEICTKQYARKSQLVLHLRVHSKVKPYNCEICHRGYTLPSSLRYHLKTHDENGQVDSKPKVKKNRRKRSKPIKRGTLFDLNVFICDICGEQYDKKSKIRKHLKRRHATIV